MKKQPHPLVKEGLQREGWDYRGGTDLEDYLYHNKTVEDLDMYCKKFGCGIKLTHEEKLYGNTCLSHQKEEKPDPTYHARYPKKHQRELPVVYNKPRNQKYEGGFYFSKTAAEKFLNKLKSA